MTNINCNEKCKHQKEGKCTLDSVVSSNILPGESKCIYYKNEKAKK